MQSSVKTNINAANEDTTRATISPPDNLFSPSAIVDNRKEIFQAQITGESVCEHVYESMST